MKTCNFIKSRNFQSDQQFGGGIFGRGLLRELLTITILRECNKNAFKTDSLVSYATKYRKHTVSQQMILK